MTDSQQAIQKQTQPPAPQLQDKLEQLKFTLPNAQVHSWKKSAYMKSLALKAQHSLAALTLSD